MGDFLTGPKVLWRGDLFTIGICTHASKTPGFLRPCFLFALTLHFTLKRILLYGLVFLSFHTPGCGTFFKKKVCYYTFSRTRHIPAPGRSASVSEVPVRVLHGADGRRNRIRMWPVRHTLLEMALFVGFVTAVKTITEVREDSPER